MIRFAHRVAMLTVAVALSLSGTVVAATSGGGPSITVPQLTVAPHVSGIIDASWDGAARFNLGYDYIYRRAASELTTVYIAQSGQALYIAWDVHQRAPQTIEQHTDGGGVYNDDHVGIAFYPQGTQGFVYIFRSNPLGAHDQFSSENSAYAPQWESAGHKTPYGYQLTMRIPLDVIRSGGSGSWHAQFTRKIVATNQDSIWTYDQAMQGDIDVNYAGTISGIDVGKAALRPPARLQVYGLGEIGSPSAGGSTSRIGADLSVPIAPTASFVATLHPDYSNVEIDQQSIAPQEFPRYYQEVRPFFTQIGSQFNYHFGCFNCPTTLYTPSIPAFGQGYAVEGTQGASTFAAFDAIGPQRTDDAQTVSFLQSNRDHQALFSVQRTNVETQSAQDVASTVATGWSFGHNHTFVYANAGTDRGTFVTDPKEGRYEEYGVGVADQTTNVWLDYQHVGSQFQPLDGYVSHPGITGLVASAGKTYNYSPKSYIQQIAISAYVDQYHDNAGRINQSDQNIYASLRTRSLLGLILGTGSSYLMVRDGEMLPFSQNSAALTYRANTATASSIMYAHGAYYHGFLGSLYGTTAIRVAKGLILSLEGDSTHYVPNAGFALGTHWDEATANELLERVSLDWQFSRRASMVVGARRIVGLFAPTGFGYAPTALSPPLNVTNVTAAFHFLALRNEFYVVYGDPSQLSTQHALFLKWIRYVGAPKGT